MVSTDTIFEIAVTASAPGLVNATNDLVKEFAQDIGKNIIVNRWGGRSRSVDSIETYIRDYFGEGVYGDNYVTINSFSTRLEPRMRMSYPSFFEAEASTPLHPDVWSQSLVQKTDAEDGINIIEPGGTIIGEIVMNEDGPKHIYLGWDAFVDASVSEKWMEWSLPLIGALISGEDISEYQERVRIALLERYRKEYIDACAARNNLKSESVREKLLNLDRQIESHRINMQQLLRDRRNTDQELRATALAEKRLSKMDDKFGNEYDVLLKNSHVEKVFVRETAYQGLQVVVKTDKLVSWELPDGTTRRMGEFEIAYNVTGGNGPFIVNLTDPWNGRQHPHYNENDNACWGNFATAIAMMYAEHEYAALTELIVKYLREPNVYDEWGRNTWAWPVEENLKGNTPWTIDDYRDHYDPYGGEDEEYDPEDE